MSKVLYECKNCGKTFLYKKDKGGLNCDECKGSLVPLGYVYAVKNEIMKMQNKIKPISIKDILEFEESLNKVKNIALTSMEDLE